jgi:hypothetical protein
MNSLCLFGFSDNEGVAENTVCYIANDGNESNDEGPAEFHPAKIETAIETPRPSLDGLEDLRVALGQTGREFTLEH